jgi:hypothetical protein
VLGQTLNVEENHAQLEREDCPDGVFILQISASGLGPQELVPPFTQLL